MTPFSDAVFNHINEMLENFEYIDVTVEQFATFAIQTFDFEAYGETEANISYLRRKAEQNFTAHLAQEALELLDGVNRRSLLLILRRIEPAIEGYGVA